MCVCGGVHTERASVFVLQLPPLVEARFGWRLLLHSALTGQFGWTLRAEVSGDMTRQPPLRGKRGVAAPHHALQEHRGFIPSVRAGVRSTLLHVVTLRRVLTLKGLSPLWVSMCLCSQLWLVDGVLYTLQPFHRHTNTCVAHKQWNKEMQQHFLFIICQRSQRFSPVSIEVGVQRTDQFTFSHLQ